jgi:ATP-dependent DNA helicase II
MYSWQDDEDGDGEGEAGDFTFSSGKHLTLFLVEATTAMAERREGDPDGYTALQRALACAHDTIKSKIFNAEKDCIGVVLFGTRPAKSADSDFETVRVLVPLCRPSSHGILTLERLLGEQGAAVFEAEVGSGPEAGVRLHEALWQCQSLFAAVPGKVATRSVLLLTCRAAPHTDAKLDGQARRKAVDLHNTDICLDVIPVCGPGETFDQDRFYRDLVKLADDDVSLGVIPLEELSESVLRKTTAKRSNGRLKLDLGGTVIAVSSYNLTRKVLRPSKQRMTADTNDEVVASRRWIHPVTGAPLLPSDMNSFVSYGGKRIK